MRGVRLIRLAVESILCAHKMRDAEPLKDRHRAQKCHAHNTREPANLDRTGDGRTGEILVIRQSRHVRCTLLPILCRVIQRWPRTDKGDRPVLLDLALPITLREPLHMRALGRIHRARHRR